VFAGVEVFRSGSIDIAEVGTTMALDKIFFDIRH
jgi:hypothetical protein